MNTTNYGRTRCRHIFTNGAQCGSPALSGESLCYYHHETRKPIANPQERAARRNTFDLPAPTNPESIQDGLSEIFLRIASNQIDPRRAGPPPLLPPNRHHQPQSKKTTKGRGQIPGREHGPSGP